jgi:hypothetical protein
MSSIQRLTGALRLHALPLRLHAGKYYVCTQPLQVELQVNMFDLLYYKYKHITPSISLSPLLTNEEVEVGFQAG